MVKVMITQPLPPVVVQQFQAVLGPTVELVSVSSLDEAEFGRVAADAEVLLSGFRKLDAKLLAMAPKVRFIQQLGAGYDNLDLEAIAQAGIKAANTPNTNSEAVAEMTVLLMLAALKQLSRADQMTRANKWNFMALSQLGLGDLAISTVGLVGLGAIGQATARRLKAFGSNLLYTSRHQVAPELEAELGVKYMTLPELLAASDIVSLHLPLNEQTRYLLGENEFNQMKKGAILVNTARGAVVDEAALRKALEQGQVGGAALDVLENEREGGNPFSDLPQVIVTPHIAGLTRGGMGRTFQRAIENIGRYAAGAEPLYIINV